MAARRETLRLAGDLRIVIDEQVDAATRDLVKAWALAWQDLTLGWADAVRPLMQADAAGERPTWAEIRRARRTQEALAATRNALDDLTTMAGIRIVQPVDVIVEQARTMQAGIIRSQLPTDTDFTVRTSLNRLDLRQMQAIVERTTQRITTLATALHPEGMATINAALARGVAYGTNPRQVAREMLQRLEGAFNLPLHRAMVIARTEMLDAHRAGCAVGQQANADVLGGWQWLAQLDTRTCPSCWSHHGEVHPLDEAGPIDHQQGRCARLPVTKTWRDLGIATPEPLSVVPDARAVFDSLPEAGRLAIMGSERLELLDSGRISWDDLSTRRRTTGWRDSFGATPVASLRRSRAA